MQLAINGFSFDFGIKDAMMVCTKMYPSKTVTARFRRESDVAGRKIVNIPAFKFN